MSGEQRIRAALYYVSLTVFILGLPFILSFSLGYKFNPRTFKFTKTGLIIIKTQPQEANVYIDEKFFSSKTPVTINELLPGTYNIRIEQDTYYPWSDGVEVDAGKITRLEKIILFPLRPNIIQLSKAGVLGFWLDVEKNTLYYLDQENPGLYRCDLDGEHTEKVIESFTLPKSLIKWAVSPDRGKLMCFNQHQISVACFDDQVLAQDYPKEFVLSFDNFRINEVFWHSDSYHLIVVTNKSVEVIEARPSAASVKLTDLNIRNNISSYDPRTDTLYFIDFQKADTGQDYDNLYKLDLNLRTSAFKDFIKLAPGFEKVNKKDEQQKRDK